MARVDAPVLRCYLGQLYNLVGVGVGAWGVCEPRGESCRTVLHGFSYEALHLVELVLRRRTVVSIHHIVPHGAVPNESGHVEGDPTFIESIEVPTHR